MAKATILGHLGNAQYSIRLHFDNTHIDAKKTNLNDVITQTNADIVDIDAKIAQSVIELNNALAALNNYIDITPPVDMMTNPDTIDQLIKQSFEKRAEYDLLNKKRRDLQTRKTSAQKELDYLEKYCPDHIDTTAWCMDYSVNLTGDVAVAEIDYCYEKGLGSLHILPGNYQPFGNPNWRLSKYIAARDYQLQHIGASSPHAAWVNLCMLPGLQKQHPRYSIGTVTAVDENHRYTVAIDLPIKHEMVYYPETASETLTDLQLWSSFPETGIPETGDRVIIARKEAKLSIPETLVPPQLGLPPTAWSTTRIYNEDCVLGFAKNPRKPADLVTPGIAYWQTIELPCSNQYWNTYFEVFDDLVTRFPVSLGPNPGVEFHLGKVYGGNGPYNYSYVIKRGWAAATLKDDDGNILPPGTVYHYNSGYSANIPSVVKTIFSDNSTAQPDENFYDPLYFDRVLEVVHTDVTKTVSAVEQIAPNGWSSDGISYGWGVAGPAPVVAPFTMTAFGEHTTMYEVKSLIQEGTWPYLTWCRIGPVTNGDYYTIYNHQYWNETTYSYNS